MHSTVPGHDVVSQAVTVCGLFEDILLRAGTRWPGGDADRALARVRIRVDALLARDPEPEAGPPRLEVRCLGPTRMVADGCGIDPPRRSRLVLQYLLAHRARPVPRDVLIERFWPGSSPACGRNSLNVAVTLLRRSLRLVYGDHPLIVFRDEAYRIAPSVDVWVDREEHERRAAEGARLRRAGDLDGAVRQYRAARALYRGSLFEDEPYEDWIAPLRREAEAVHVDALTDLGACLAALGDLEGSDDAYRAVLALEPHNEEVHRLLIERYAAEGRRSLALRQYEACRDALRRLLDAEPGPELAALRQRIAAGGLVRDIRKSPVIAA